MNFIDLVVEIENRLGWIPPEDGKPAWQHRRIAAGAIKKMAAKDPRTFALPNLMRTVSYMERKRITVKHPAGIMYYVEKANKDRSIETMTDLEQAIQSAVAKERALGDPSGWADRLSRATGVYRKQTYQEYINSR